jgi:hypothetical protein
MALLLSLGDPLHAVLCCVCGKKNREPDLGIEPRTSCSVGRRASITPVGLPTLQHAPHLVFVLSPFTMALARRVLVTGASRGIGLHLVLVAWLSCTS